MATTGKRPTRSSHTEEAVSRLTLDLSALQVDTFAAEAAAPLIYNETYPDCPTATGCTCIASCQSAVRPACPDTITITAAAE